MSHTYTTKQLQSQFADGPVKMGDIKKLAKDIKKDHEFAQELWRSGQFPLRMLATLIADKKLLDQTFIEQWADDIQAHPEKEANQITDWLMANQLMKDKATIELLDSWESHTSPVLRRMFWYFQGRKYWSKVYSHDNVDALLTSLEKDMSTAEPTVQWAMNFTAAQIGIHDAKRRARCVALGKKLELYKDLKAPKNCTPLYMPEWIRIEVEKLTPAH